MTASKPTVVHSPDSSSANATVAQQARTIVAYHGERILAEIPTTLRRLSLLLLVLAITVPIFLAGLLVVLWQLTN